MDDMAFRTMRTLSVSLGILFAAVCISIVLEVSIPQVVRSSEFGPPVPGKAYSAREMQIRDAAAARQLAEAIEASRQERPTIDSFTKGALVRFQWPLAIAYLVVAALMRRASPGQQFLAMSPFVAVVLNNGMSLWLVPTFLAVVSTSVLLRYCKNRAVET